MVTISYHHESRVSPTGPVSDGITVKNASSAAHAGKISAARNSWSPKHAATPRNERSTRWPSRNGSASTLQYR